MKNAPQLGFWAGLLKPAFVLAPMANVTDAAFRRVIAKYGKPDVFWTEFVSADGLCANETARERLLPDLWYSEEERPIVAQIFGSKPENIEETAALCRELGFDGIDINMGCPDRSVNKQGAGAALSKEPALAQTVVRAAQRGAGELPVSVKIRLGFNTNETDEWVPALLETRPAVITVHGRTRKEMSKVPARWEDIAHCVAIRNAWSDEHNIPEGGRTLIFGNGDVESLADAREKAEAYNVDGVMLGRAIFGNPWRFNREVEREDVPEAARLEALREHVTLFDELFMPRGLKHFAVMKKHFKSYVSGFARAKEITMALMDTENADEALAVIDREIERAR